MDKRDDEIFSYPIKAGKRTYFFDVKATRDNEYYLTITESKRKVDTDGRFTYDKHKIFLYKEDFEKFAEGFKKTIDFIKTSPNMIERQQEREDVNFDDL
ncbi:MAG: DUF3276 family protein [Bacteroidales bacterium]